MAYFSSHRAAALVWLLFVVAAVPSFATTWYVTPTGIGTGSISWANASSDLQDVITNKAVFGDQIWVAQGTYTPTYDGNGVQFPAAPRTRCFILKDGVAIYGGFSGAGTELLLTDRNFKANPTILSGDFAATPGDPTDDAYHVVVSVNDGIGAILDGFVIEKGNSNGSTFPLIEGIFTEENAGGGLYAPTGSPTIQNCIFQQNLSGNFGAGLGTRGSPIVQGCFFLNNTAAGHGGGFGSVQSSPQLINCVFAGNACGNNGGGGIYCNSSGGSPAITNCTIYGNSCGGNGGGFVNQIGTSILTNTIIWGNTPSAAGQVYNDGGGTITASNNLVEGGISGTANIDANPYFNNPADLNGVDNQYFTDDDGLKIGDCSPARGAATAGPTEDITGLNRALGDAIGAYANSNAASTLSAVSFLSVSPVCPAAGTTLNLNYSGGTAPVTMVYTDGTTNYTINNYISGANITPPAPTATTTYTLVSLIDAQGCADGNPSLNFTDVTVYSPITVTSVSVDKPTICNGGDATITLTITGGTSPYSLIYTANGVNAITIGPFFSGNGLFTAPVTTTEFEVTFLEDANGCSAGLTTGDVTQTVTVLSGVGSHIYVKANATGAGTGYSWDDAFTSLQAAIDFANTCTGLSEIWVAEGYYYPTKEPDGTTDSPRDFAFVIPDGINLYGGFPNTGNPVMSDRNPGVHVTRLSGDYSVNDSYDTSGPNVLGGRSENAHHIVIAVNHATPSVIDGFHIEGGNADGVGFVTVGVGSVPRNAGGGVYLDNAPISLKNTVIFTNIAETGGGIYQINSFSNHENCFFYRNKATGVGSGGGMFANGPTSFSVQNTVFWGNDAAEGGGTYVSGGSSPLFEHCTFSYNATTLNGDGIYVLNTFATVQNSIFWGNFGSVTKDLFNSGTGAIAAANCIVQPGSAYAGGTNSVADPLFANMLWPYGPDGFFMTADDGIRLACGSPAINAGSATVLTNDILGNNRVVGLNPDLGAYEFAPSATRTQLYVDANVSNGGTKDGSSWADAFSSLANALQSVQSCNPNVSEIWVADGTYYPEYQTDGTTADPLLFSFSIPYGVSLYGGFSGNEQYLSDRNYNVNITILSGDVNTDGTMAGNAYHVVHQAIFETYATVDGFTIQDGNATGAGINANGGGILLEDGAELTVSNCIVASNEATGNGGGMYATNTNLVVKNSEVSNNTAQNGGGIATNGGSANIFNTNIILNIANMDGAGMYLAGGTPKIFNTVLYDNAAFGSGAGIYTLSSSASIINCTFSGNDAFTDGGGVHDNGGGSTIANSIFWGNTPASNEIAGSGGNATAVSYAIVQSAAPYAGSNNTINADPLFEDALDPAGADGQWRTADDGLRPRCASPALNAGNNALLPDDTYDLNGNFDTEEWLPIDITGVQRAQGTAVNMGAYEVVDLSGTATRLYVNDDASGLNDGTSWANAFTSLQAAFDALSCNPTMEIWVAGGIYKPTKDINGNIPGDPRQATFDLPDGITLYGGFAGTETQLSQHSYAAQSYLSGDFLGDDVVSGSGATLTIAGNTENAYHVVVVKDLTMPTYLDGFTIQGGHANSAVDFLGIVDGNNNGGGVFVANSGTSLNMFACQMNGNAATNFGGGIFIANASPHIENNSVFYNAAGYGGGISMAVGSDPAISHGSISYNRANSQGGGMNINASSPSFLNITLAANACVTDGGGMYVTNASNPTFTQCYVVQNHATFGSGGGICNSGATTTLNKSLLLQNIAYNNGGAAFNFNAGTINLTNCTVFENTCTEPTATAAGLYNENGSGGNIQNAIFWNNTTPANTTDAGAEEIISTGLSGNLAIWNSLVRDPLPVANTSGGANVSADPLFVNAALPAGVDGNFATADDGLMLTSCSPAQDLGGSVTGSDILGTPHYDNPAINGMGAIDAGAYEVAAANSSARLYVDGALGSGAADGSSWANAFRGATALQDALDAECSGAEIWVKGGTYKPSKDPFGNQTPSDNRDKTFFINKSISLYGGFAGTETALTQRTTATIHANPAVLSGDFSGNDIGFSGNTENAYHVALTAVGNTITMDGFTILGGNANGGGSVVVDANPAVMQNRGGGIYVHYHSPAIKNCIFNSNYAVYGGGGYLNNTYANLTDCTFDTNTGGSQGGGLFTIAGQPTITNGIFVANVGGSEGGGMYCANSGPIIRNAVFANNSTPGNGGGLYSFENIPIIENSTFYQNSAQNGGGLYNYDAIPQLTNAILWDNTATNGNANEKQAIAAGISGSGHFIASIVQDGLPPLMTHDGNTSVANPNFANPATPFPAGQRWRTSNDGLIPMGCGLQIGTAIGGFDITGNGRQGASTPGAYEATGVLSAAVGVTPETNTLTAINNTGRTNYRYANVVNAFSTEYSGSFAAANVLGAPSVYPGSDIGAAGQWSPNDAIEDFVDVSFPNPAPIDFVDIYESWGPGAVTKVEVYNPVTLAFQTVYTANASEASGVSGESRLLHIPFSQTAFNVDRVKITISQAVAHYKNIDAIAIGQADLAYTYTWTPAASTSAIVPTANGNYVVNMTSGGCTDNADEDYNFGDVEIQGNGLTILDGNTSPHPSRGTSFQPVQFLQTFQIINKGGAMLTISSIDLTGPGAAMFTVSGFTPFSSLLPGDTTTFTLNFAPSVSGIFDATITVNSNDTDEAAYDFAVTATAVAAEALAFDGVDDYVTAPYYAGYETGALTVEMWVKPNFTNQPVGNPLLAANRDATNARWSYHILNDLSGIGFWNGSSVVNWNYTFTNNQWYHIAFSTGPAITEAYVNGVSIGTQLATFGASTGLPLLIGGNPNTLTEFFSGEIDEVRIWDNTICRNQIPSYLNCEVNPASANLVAYFRFNQGLSAAPNATMTTVDDLSTSNQDGTLTNFALTGAASNWVAPGGVVTGVSCNTTLFADIQVRGNGNDINSGDNTPSLTDHTEFAFGPGNRIFTLNNIGFSDLVVDYITITGTNATEFSHNGSAGTITDGGSYSFTVTYTPGGTGTHTATVQISSTDCDEPLYTFDISATNGPARFYVNDDAAGLNNGNSWTDAYTSLQSALEQAVAGDSVWMAAGTYLPTKDTTGNANPTDVQMRTFRVPTGVVVVGGFAGSETAISQRSAIAANATVLSGNIGLPGSATDNAYHVVTMNTATLDGLVISGANADSSLLAWQVNAGVWCKGGSPTVTRCIIRDNHANHYGAGIGVDFGQNVTINECIFENNTSLWNGGGLIIDVQTNATVLVEHCVFSGNSAASGAGVFFYSGAATYTAQVQRCTFANNTGGAVGTEFVPDVLISNCVMWGNTGADVFPYQGTAPQVEYSLVEGGYTGTGNIDSDPFFVNAADPDGVDNLWRTADDGLSIVCGSPAENTGTGSGKDITGAAANGIKDMGAYEWQGFAGTPTVLYVNQSATGSQDGDTWGDAFRELTTALACEAITPSVTEIWVAGGTYKPTTGTDRTASFPLRNNLALYGGFAGTEAVLGDRVLAVPSTSILTGEIGSAGAGDNSYHVVKASGVDATAILNGFTLDNGNADGAGDDGKGGGLLIDGAYPLVESCTISQNKATDGAGVAILNPGTNAAQLTELKDCTITNNTATNSGGGIYAEQMMVKFIGGTSIYANGTGPGACE